MQQLQTVSGKSGLFDSHTCSKEVVRSMNVRAEPLCGLFIVGRAIFCGIACDQPFVTTTMTTTYFEKTSRKGSQLTLSSPPVATNFAEF